MSNTYKKQSHKFDDEPYSGRSGKHSNHKNNHKFNGIPIVNESEIEDDLLEMDVESSINKE
jgi:hypothetical protein